MITFIKHKKTSVCYKLLCSFISFSFLFSVVLPPRIASAQLIPPTVLNLPVPGTMVPMTEGFAPVMLTGVTVHPENPLKFDFIVNKGDATLEDAPFKEEARKSIKYFLASMTVPEKDLWVNLSPYEKDKMVPEGLGTTEMGRDMLAQDYLLKQLTASLMYPEKELGKKFWDEIYKKAREQYGTDKVPTNTFNKVWIVPEKAVVYERGLSAYVVSTHLKVMLAQDYEALNHGASAGDTDHPTSAVETQIIREVIIPAIEKEVNDGKNFANLRQIYNALILATWYKEKIKGGLLSQVYVDQNKTKGIDVQDKQINEKIYDQYLASFKKGVYNYIREDYDPATKDVTPRKYFSGGLGFAPQATGFPGIGAIERDSKIVSGAVASPVEALAVEGINRNGLNVEFGVVLAENGTRTAAAKVEKRNVSSPVQQFLHEAAAAATQNGFLGGDEVRVAEMGDQGLMAFYNIEGVGRKLALRREAQRERTERIVEAVKGNIKRKFEYERQKQDRGLSGFELVMTVKDDGTNISLTVALVNYEKALEKAKKLSEEEPVIDSLSLEEALAVWAPAIRREKNALVPIVAFLVVGKYANDIDRETLRAIYPIVEAEKAGLLDRSHPDVKYVQRVENQIREALRQKTASSPVAPVVEKGGAQSAEEVLKGMLPEGMREGAIRNYGLADFYNDPNRLVEVAGLQTAAFHAGIATPAVVETEKGKPVRMLYFAPAGERFTVSMPDRGKYLYQVAAAKRIQVREKMRMLGTITEKAHALGIDPGWIIGTVDHVSADHIMLTDHGPVIYDFLRAHGKLSPKDVLIAVRRAKLDIGDNYSSNAVRKAAVEEFLRAYAQARGVEGRNEVNHFIEMLIRAEYFAINGPELIKFQSTPQVRQAKVGADVQFSISVLMPESWEREAVDFYVHAGIPNGTPWRDYKARITKKSTKLNDHGFPSGDAFYTLEMTIPHGDLAKQVFKGQFQKFGFAAFAIAKGVGPEDPYFGKMRVWMGDQGIQDGTITLEGTGPETIESRVVAGDKAILESALAEGNAVQRTKTGAPDQLREEYRIREKLYKAGIGLPAYLTEEPTGNLVLTYLSAPDDKYVQYDFLSRTSNPPDKAFGDMVGYIGYTLGSLHRLGIVLGNLPVLKSTDSRYGKELFETGELALPFFLKPYDAEFLGPFIASRFHPLIDLPSSAHRAGDLEVLQEAFGFLQALSQSIVPYGLAQEDIVPLFAKAYAQGRGATSEDEQQLLIKQFHFTMDFVSAKSDIRFSDEAPVVKKEGDRWKAVVEVEIADPQAMRENVAFFAHWGPYQDLGEGETWATQKVTQARFLNPQEVKDNPHARGKFELTFTMNPAEVFPGKTGDFGVTFVALPEGVQPTPVNINSDLGRWSSALNKDGKFTVAASSPVQQGERLWAQAFVTKGPNLRKALMPDAINFGHQVEAVYGKRMRINISVLEVGRPYYILLTMEQFKNLMALEASAQTVEGVRLDLNGSEGAYGVQIKEEMEGEGKYRLTISLEPSNGENEKITKEILDLLDVPKPQRKPVSSPLSEQELIDALKGKDLNALEARDAESEVAQNLIELRAVGTRKAYDELLLKYFDPDHFDNNPFLARAIAEIVNNHPNDFSAEEKEKLKGGIPATMRRGEGWAASSPVLSYAQVALAADRFLGAWNREGSLAAEIKKERPGVVFLPKRARILVIEFFQELSFLSDEDLLTDTDTRKRDIKRKGEFDLAHLTEDQVKTIIDIVAKRYEGLSLRPNIPQLRRKAAGLEPLPEGTRGVILLIGDTGARSVAHEREWLDRVAEKLRMEKYEVVETLEPQSAEELMAQIEEEGRTANDMDLVYIMSGQERPINAIVPLAQQLMEVLPHAPVVIEESRINPQDIHLDAQKMRGDLRNVVGVVDTMQEKHMIHTLLPAVSSPVISYAEAAQAADSFLNDWVHRAAIRGAIMKGERGVVIDSDRIRTLLIELFQELSLLKDEDRLAGTKLTKSDIKSGAMMNLDRLTTDQMGKITDIVAERYRSDDKRPNIPQLQRKAVSSPVGEVELTVDSIIPAPNRLQRFRVRGGVLRDEYLRISKEIEKNEARKVEFFRRVERWYEEMTESMKRDRVSLEDYQWAQGTSQHWSHIFQRHFGTRDRFSLPPSPGLIYPSAMGPMTDYQLVDFLVASVEESLGWQERGQSLHQSYRDMVPTARRRKELISMMLSELSRRFKKEGINQENLQAVQKKYPRIAAVLPELVGPKPDTWQLAGNIVKLVTVSSPVTTVEMIDEMLRTIASPGVYADLSIVTISERSFLLWQGEKNSDKAVEAGRLAGIIDHTLDIRVAPVDHGNIRSFVADLSTGSGEVSKQQVVDWLRTQRAREGKRQGPYEETKDIVEPGTIAQIEKAFANPQLFGSMIERITGKNLVGTPRWIPNGHGDLANTLFFSRLVVRYQEPGGKTEYQVTLIRRREQKRTAGQIIRTTYSIGATVEEAVAGAENTPGRVINNALLALTELERALNEAEGAVSSPLKSPLIGNQIKQAMGSFAFASLTPQRRLAVKHLVRDLARTNDDRTNAVAIEVRGFFANRSHSQLPEIKRIIEDLDQLIARTGGAVPRRVAVPAIAARKRIQPPPRVSSPLEATPAPGGIDLNPALWDLQIKRDGNGVPLPLPQQPIGTMHIDGFVPIIINVTPVPNLPLLLGFASTPGTEHAAGVSAKEGLPPADRLQAKEVEEVSYLN